MSGNDGRVGAQADKAGCPGPVRTVIEGGTGSCIGAWRQAAESAPAGVVLDLSGATDDLRIVIVDHAGAPAHILGPFPEEDVIAVWRSIALASGLTPMMRAWNGRTEPLACQLGRLRLGRTQDRRRTGVLNRRRPRFLVRRKSTRLPPRPLVFREPEIAGGRGR